MFHRSIKSIPCLGPSDLRWAKHIENLFDRLGVEFAEADEAQQQEFWSKLQAGDPGAI